jgi:hypothetical protein
MDTSLGSRVEKAMQAAGIKARSFAALVGCHYTTIYDLVKNPEVIPLRIMQERILDALDFLDDAVRNNRLPINDPKKGVAEKTKDLERMFQQYKQKELSQST